MCAYYRTRQQGRVQCMQWKLATCTHAACQLVRMHTCVSVDPLALRGPRQTLAINAEALGVGGRGGQMGVRGAGGCGRGRWAWDKILQIGAKNDDESCSSVAEHWHGKPKALGLIPGSSTFLSCSFAISKVFRQ